MTPEVWKRLKPLYYAALELPVEARARYVAEACGNDKELKKELTALLKASDGQTDSVDTPIVNLSDLFPAEARSFSDGELILGRFRIVRYVGGGGMGEVYEAIDLEMGRIALKTIRPEIASNPEMLSRFKKEVTLALKISGPHVCRIHAFYPLTDSANRSRRALLTMEFLDGITLADKISESGPLPWREAKAIAIEICSGLQTIHEAGVIHRDLKSRNIMLASRNGSTCAVLMDFGLAREFHGPTSETVTDVNSSSKGEIAGTVAYMAPEQFEGKIEVTPATDVYALGVVLYELVTGKHAFEANTPIGAAIHRAKHPTPAHSVQRKIPRLCDRVIERCLEYEPEQRFQSANEVAKALQTGPANLTNIRKDRPWILQLACALVLAAIAWGGFQAWQSWRYDRLNPPALKWYNDGVAALREGSNVKATRLLSTAVDNDKHFAMTHAWLAEAWANLDFEGKSTQEMLIALGGEHHLRPLDSLYLNAIHAALTRDYAGAVLVYKRILDRLRDNTQRAAGYVDLGMAYERAGDPMHATESYIKSETLDSNNPAPYMHEAILDSRLHKVSQANQAFSNAEAIFARELNQEGQAELDFERGYLANQNGDTEQANRFLEESLQEAEKIQDVQLEIRVLTQLSSVSYNADQDAKAIEQAQRAIRLARENQLDAWAADGLVRLANARVDQGSEHFQEAEDAIQEGLKMAQQTQQSRVEALANLTLASLRNQQHRPDEVIAAAQKALDYYRQNGYFEPAAKASLLLIRTQRNKGHIKEALQAGNSFLILSTASGERELIMEAEEVVGTVFFWMEQYPEALAHFQRARLSADTNGMRSFQSLHCAEALSRLGRYTEGDTLLGSIPPRSALAPEAAEIHIASLLSQRKYPQALAASKEIMAEYPTMASDIKLVLVRYRVIAEAHMGMKKQALSEIEKIISESGYTEDSANRAVLNLAVAEVNLAAGLAKEARDAALAAESYYASTGQRDSQLRSICLAAAASKAMKDNVGYSSFFTKEVDILSELQQTWEPQAFQTYISRPDLRALTPISHVGSSN